MRRILLLLLLPSLLVAQKRYLVTPNDEFIQLKSGNNRLKNSSRTGEKVKPAVSAYCGTQYSFGWPPNMYPSNFTFGVRHKDAIGDWFVAKATGTIDTIYWEQTSDVGAMDSTAYLRISRSYIGPDFGPGIRPGPYNPPCQNWGYWQNTNDLDKGVAAFTDEATDSTWISTYNGPTPSTPPFGSSLLPGPSIAVTLHAGNINWVSLVEATGSPLYVQAGDKFFISFTARGLSGHSNDKPTYFFADGFHVDPSDENYPSRAWKFYEHDSGASNCSGVPVNLVKRGWVARGGFSNDSLDVAMLTLWYTMTPTVNVGPDVFSMSFIHSTLNTASEIVNADILDCDFEIPTRAGAKFASLKWQLNGVNQIDIPMTFEGGITWSGVIPGEPAGSTISYRVYAEDSTGLSFAGQLATYRIVETSNRFAQVDTIGPCTAKSISGNPGNVISPSDFYLPPGAPQNAMAINDGTAGPFDMGSNMPLFGDVGRYMWIGVDGGVAISKSPTDTVDVNAGGQYSKYWSFPFQGSMRHGGRSDVDGSLRMPGNFFAPFWSDLWNSDSANGTPCGHMRFQKGYGSDTCQVIVEWDSLGLVPIYAGNQPDCSPLTFRAIFNKCDGTIEYQYDNTDWFPWPSVDDQYYYYYLDYKPVLIGFEADSTHLTVPNPMTHGRPGVLINENGYPFSTIPVSGSCFKIYQSTINTADAGWNLLSVGVRPPQDNYTKSALYPAAITPAFAYAGSYKQKSTLKNGEGYWMKFAQGDNAGARGALLDCVVDSLRNGWNLLGSVGCSVETGLHPNITVGGGATLISPFLVYSGSYHFVTTLLPGYGFWVKSSGAGTLTICCGTSTIEPKTGATPNLTLLNTVTITDNQGRHQTLYLSPDDAIREPLDYYELPPAAPEFDARFASDRMVESYPAHLTEKGIYQYPIEISTEAYPLTISWNIINRTERSFVLKSSDKKQGSTLLQGSGKLKISDANVKEISVALENISFPKEFALHQNFPNPFNPATQIRYDIRDAGFVTLKVFDVLGKEVATLVNENLSPGEYSATWNAANFSSGIYFVSMKAGTFSDVKKVVLVR